MSSRPGGSRPSIRDVAAEAGVAISSVSRVLREHPDVSPRMRERVLAAVERLGYEPDLLAQALRSQRTMSVGFVIGDISNPVVAEIVTGAERRLQAAGYSMLLTNSENDPRRDAAHVRLLRRRRVDGLLISHASERSEATLEALRALDVPIVLIDRQLPAGTELDAAAVLSDHRAGMEAAIRHLLDLGHRRIGLVLGQDVRPSAQRRLAIEHVYAERGLPLSYIVCSGTFTRDFGREATRRLLSEEERPTAIVAGGNQLLVGVLEELRAHGVRVGEDVSIVSCDRVPFTDLLDPPIAVVRRDATAMGNVAADLLLRRMQGVSGITNVVLPTDFAPTDSCRPPRGRRAAGPGAALS